VTHYESAVASLQLRIVACYEYECNSDKSRVDCWRSDTGRWLVADATVNAECTNNSTAFATDKNGGWTKNRWERARLGGSVLFIHLGYRLLPSGMGGTPSLSGPIDADLP